MIFIYDMAKKTVNKFIQYLGENFDIVKRKFEEYITNMGYSFDEDVFSDTILKCDGKLEGKEMPSNEMISYFFMAFKNNTLREKKYARNNTTDKIPENVLEEDGYNEDMVNEITKMIIDKFGPELYGLFLMHANGKKYNELDKLTEHKNLKYKFRKIREYVRANYKFDDIK